MNTQQITAEQAIKRHSYLQQSKLESMTETLLYIKKLAEQRTSEQSYLGSIYKLVVEELDC